jgi:hypothetical protein
VFQAPRLLRLLRKFIWNPWTPAPRGTPPSACVINERPTRNRAKQPSTTNDHGSPVGLLAMRINAMSSPPYSSVVIASSPLPVRSASRPGPSSRDGLDREAGKRAKVGHAGAPRVAQQRDLVEVDAEPGHRSARGDARTVHHGRKVSIGLGSASMPPLIGIARGPGVTMLSH